MKTILHNPLAGRYLLVTAVLVFFCIVQVNGQVVRYVDASRTSGNGLSWSNAYPTLKAALDEANANTSITEIRVAKGTYYPTGDQTGTDRNAAFGIYRRNLAILGGYPTGGSGPRNWDTNPTILSGEINDVSSQRDNSYHVVVVAGQLSPSTGDLMIEGFRVHWGRADGGSTEVSYNQQPVKRNAGGGIAIVGLGNANWLRVRNCVVSGNYAGDIGAGVYVRNTNMNLIGSLISGNYADYCGGIFVHNTVSVSFRLNITNCTIVGNHANHDAGGLRISGGQTNVALANTVIFNNSGGVGGNEYISIKDGASYQDTGCLFQWRDNMNPWFTTVIPPGTVNIDGEYWPSHDRASALNERGIDNVSDLGELDLKCNPRVACITDIGAYEYRKHPNIIGQPQSANICHSQNTSFSVSFAGVGADFIEWEEKKANSGTFRKLTNSGIYSGVNSTTLTLTNVPYDYQNSYNEIYNGSTFRCIMWNEQCAKVISQEVVLTVRQPMHITVDPTPKTICAGQSVTFSADALNGTGFQWEYDDGTGFKNVPATSTYAGRTSKVLTINPVTVQMNNHLYRVKVTSLCSGTKTSESAKLTVRALTSIAQSPVDQVVCVPQTGASFSVQAANATTYRWEYNDGSDFKNVPSVSPYSGANTATLQISAVSEQMNNYVYRAAAIGSCAPEAISGNARLTVKPLPEISRQPEDVFACAGATVSFSIEQSQGNRFKWYYDDGSGFKEVPEGAPYAGVHTATLSVSPTTVQLGSYRYRCQVARDDCAPVLSAEAALFMGRKFVKAGSSGSGNSWNDASGDLQEMINLTCEGGEVWVGKGIYIPLQLAGDGTDTRDKAFVLKKGVKIYGGFTGTEAALSERDLTVSANRSILSGDVNGDDIVSGHGSTLSIANNSENLYHVLIAAGDLEGAELNGFTVRGGNANGSGTITVNEKIITRYYGGGMQAMETGSAAFYLSHLIFQGNRATYGGAIQNWTSSPVLSQVLISQNLADEAGGIYNHTNASPRLFNVTLAGNRATSLAGAMVNLSSSPQVRNSVIWGNSSGIFNISSSPGYAYSLVQGLTAWGTILDADPLFVDAANGDYRLQSCSPAINAGDPAVTDGTDLAGNPRVLSGRVDMGAYEFQGIPPPVPPIIASQSICSGNATVADLLSIGSNLNWYTAPTGGTPLTSATLLTTRTYYASQTRDGCESLRTSVAVTTQPAPPVANLSQIVVAGHPLSDLVVSGNDLKWYDAANDGNVLLSSSIVQSGKYYVSQTVNGCESSRLEITITVSSSSTFYVKQGANGSGVSWEDASGDLQAMIDLVGAEQVWVAKGIYLPFRRAGNGTDDRDKAFVLRKGVKIYGGFAGTEAALSERDLTLSANRSVLSGDVNGDDIVSGHGSTLSIANNSENLYHVLIAAGDITGAELNGFTVSGGNANSSGTITVNEKIFTRHYGAGMKAMETGSATYYLNHLIFVGNSANSGGAIFNYKSSPVLSQVLISHNLAAYEGGAIYNHTDASPRLSHVTLAGNRTTSSTGAMVNLSSSPQVRNSVIWGNSSGILDIYFSTPTYAYSLVQGLTASGTNLNADPLFVDAANGDYRLQSCSPAINAGDPAVVGGTDLTGNLRVQLGRVDMGAYEASSIAGAQTGIASNGNRTATAHQLSSGTTWYASDCNNLLLSVTGWGDEPVEGTTRARVWITPTEGFVGRRYEISPENNADRATGRVTLYFTQADFTAYNRPDRPGLPTGPEDEAGIKNLRVQKRNGSSYTGEPSSYPGAPTEIDPVDKDIVWSAALSRWEVSFVVRGFSGFFVYAVDDAALPVSLVSFKAEPLEESVALSWQTTEEVNVSHFEVERSSDARNWTRIGKVDASGHHSGLRSYELKDVSPLTGLNYYRLRMVDTDKSFAYSTIASATLSKEQASVLVYPTVVESGRVTVAVSGISEPKITIFDLNGRAVSVPVLQKSREAMVFDVTRLSSGIYLVAVRGARSAVRRFVVK